jgi:putative membrane protein insertion efficiency factor
MLKKILIAPFLFLIIIYQGAISPFLPKACRFEPSCSSYFAQSLRMHGFFYGFFLGIKRIVRCHPWNKPGYDPVPEKKCNH